MSITGCRKKEESIEKNTSHEKAFTISDVSKDCLSNSIYVYYDKKYEVYKAYYEEGNEIKPIRDGEYDYDINKIINNIKDYGSDKNNYINYKVTIGDKSYVVSQTEKNELREFMDSINGDSLLWCE